MSERIDPVDAVRALGEIDQRREQAIRRPVFPGWSWWAYGALMTMFAACAESGSGVVLWIGFAVFVAGMFVVDRRVFRRARAASLHRSLTSRGTARRTLVAMAAFVVALLGLAVAVGLGLKAAGVPYPGTIAAAVTAPAFAVGGQKLVGYEAAMLVRRSRSRQ